METLVLQYAKFLLLALSIISNVYAFGQVDTDRPVFNTVERDGSGPTKLFSTELETSADYMHPLSGRVPKVQSASAQIQTLVFISRPERYLLHRLEVLEPENISLEPVIIFGDPEDSSTGFFKQFRDAVLLAYNAWKAIQLVRADVPVLLEGVTRAAVKNPAS